VALNAVAGAGVAGTAAAASAYQDPVLVSGTDGVGTKLKIAFMMDKHDTVGIDCVAYCVNDIVCSGAQPLLFLDYIGTGRLVPETVADIVKGVAAGCVAAGAALVGGETAELPGFYAPEEYDLAGFSVGVVERARIIDGSRAATGDALVGLASTGLQSSGFSLVRRALFDLAGRRVTDHVDDFGRTLGEELLTPTAVYPRLILHLMESFDIRAVANISGGGFYDNIPRVLPGGLGARVRRGTWTEPAVFDFVRRAGRVEDPEMFRTFNMGVGMILVVPADQADAVCRAVAGWGGAPPEGAPEPGPGAGPAAPAGPNRPAPSPEAARALEEMAPLVALAQPPRKAWVIGEIVPAEKLGAAAGAAGRRVVISDKGGREF